MNGAETQVNLRPHALQLALFQPQIAPNTGNIARLCVATGTALHLVRPMGFVLSDHNLRRSAMDYWPRLRLTVHDDEAAFFAAMAGRRFWLLTSKGSRSFWAAKFRDGDCLILGSETRGLSEELIGRYRENAIRIPQAPGERCLNLSTAAGIAIFEGLRQIQSME